MEDPLLTTEFDEMTRAFDPNNTDVSPAANTGPGSAVDRMNKNGISPHASTPLPAVAPVRRAAPTQAVCPFCGSVNESIAGSCRQCNMENTQATRQATRSKIGPWFVWQSRNPSAPGMNWATLLSLVEKGRITPRSVVRGPTTGQLWRFAARVKGISREFGACWHCGGELIRTARLCSSCKRLQQPPINPNALLETSSDANIAPVHKSVADPNYRGHVNLGGNPVRREVPSPIPVPGAASVGILQSPPPTDFPIDPSVPIIDMEDETLPAGMEMRAFQLDEDGSSGTLTSGTFKRIFLAATITFLTVLPVLYWNPQVRPHYVHWYQQFRGWIRNAPPQNWFPKQEPVLDGNSYAVPPNSIAAPTTLLSVPPNTKNETKSIVPIEPIAETAPKFLFKPKEQDSLISLDPEATSPKAAERRSWEHYERAIKSEQRADFATAIKEYEWIEQLRLPEGTGPSDVESRLQRARELYKKRINE